MKILEVKTSKKIEFIDITNQIYKIIKEENIKNGVCYLFIPHTTAGITINENADPSVKEDIINMLNKIVPENWNYEHLEGNSPAHIKSSLVGHSEVIFIENGELALGTWQGIFLCEFDGPRRRKVFIKIIKA
jgi:secondary thiamine-phosphate synthase enzyme